MNTTPLSSPKPSRAALAAGVAARFFYWSGRSGRRYLFSCMAGARLADFEEGVAMAVSGDSIVWVGDVTALARMPREAAPRRAAIFLHLLASTEEERRAVIEDLRPRRVAALPIAGSGIGMIRPGYAAWRDAPAAA